MKLVVEGHDGHVAEVLNEENERLPRMHLGVAHEESERPEAKDIVVTIAEERPPGERQDLVRGHGAEPDDEQHVEHGGAHDGAEAHVGLGEEHAADRREKFRGGTAGGHEGSAGDIRRNLPVVHHLLEGSAEVLVTHQAEAGEHVDDAQGVEEDAPLVIALAVRLGQDEVGRVAIVPRLRRGRRGRREGVIRLETATQVGRAVQLRGGDRLVPRIYGRRILLRRDAAPSAVRVRAEKQTHIQKRLQGHS
mmetsp:Transcript_1811/g.5202  ORF Transcript_1811/g.5202 Transcript_1811/m.5202 type:complete len:249 (+) Transcript_1811:2155-2901(+)